MNKPSSNQNQATVNRFSRLELAVLADSWDGTVSKAGRAELVHALTAYKAEHSALCAVVEAASDLRHVERNPSLARYVANRKANLDEALSTLETGCG